MAIPYWLFPIGYYLLPIAYCCAVHTTPPPPWGPGWGRGGDKLGWGHIEILDKAPTYSTKVATKAY